MHKGQPIEIRFDQEKMYIELPDGRELETKIVRKVEQPGGAQVHAISELIYPPPA